MKKQHFIAGIACIIFLACGGPEPRKPVKVKTASYIKESVERNKKMLEMEEKMISEIIKKDSLHFYQNTSDGSWFHYLVKNDTAQYTPKMGDMVALNYNLVSFDNDTIYTKEEIGNLTYLVDKQEDLFPGLRNSVKILKEGETATFLFPSSMAYGYHGDNNKIGTNVPVRSTISILQIEKQKDSIQN
ncbi:gliding motility-associated peptidyl-prolyl isomerase [Saonia flava]|uniref:Peptidyl-prolyl cis-trans isomerase n=1 Tax=Saonia flava TaxID=523696 RepID=A0A846QZD4_9FLAO|nr:gliding motility-associated peptidyl-prolyl isomerase GldI [Saonia flava]NJB72280.1 gliding motility-associated peptidyl-prolyl isomerase [Saonia flava]